MNKSLDVSAGSGLVPRQRRPGDPVRTVAAENWLRPRSTSEGPAFSAELLLSSLGQAVIATDPTGVIVAWNPAAERLYGWTAAEALGRDITTLLVRPVVLTATESIMTVVREGGARTGGLLVRA